MPAPPVQWQTAVSLLVPLAITAMAQPSGRFLDIDPKFRMYLRSVPFLCLADTVSVIVHLTYFAVSSEVSFHQEFRTFLWERFVHDEGCEEQLAGEGLRTLNDTSWMRWAFLGLGTVWPSLKIVGGLVGLPWTTAWGWMFLSSILVTEVLVWFACRLLLETHIPIVSSHNDDLESHSQHQHQPQQPLLQGGGGEGAVELAGATHRPPTSLSTSYRYSNAAQPRLDKEYSWIFLLGFVLHLGLLFWTAWDLKPEPEGRLRSLRRLFGELPLSALAIFLASMVVFPFWGIWVAIVVAPLVFLASPFLIFLIVSGRGDLIDDFSRRHSEAVMVISCLVATVPSYFGFLWVFKSNDQFSFKWTCIDSSFLLAAMVASLLLAAILHTGSRRSCGFGRKFSLIQECHCLDELKPDTPRRKCVVSEKGCFLATMFFLTVILLFLWYPLRYDPTDTYARSWTSAVDGS